MKQTITLEIPHQLALMCKLLDTTPQAVLQAFINNASLEVNSSGSDERRMAVEYFMRCGYGMHRYSFDEVQQMFDELDQLRQRWLGNDEEKEKQYLQLRKASLKQWHKEWEARMQAM